VRAAALALSMSSACVLHGEFGSLLSLSRSKFCSPFTTQRRYDLDAFGISLVIAPAPIAADDHRIRLESPMAWIGLQAHVRDSVAIVTVTALSISVSTMINAGENRK